MAVIDTEYAKSTSFLKDHNVDLQLESFRINDPHGNPIDANYFVVELIFA